LDHPVERRPNKVSIWTSTRQLVAVSDIWYRLNDDAYCADRHPQQPSQQVWPATVSDQLHTGPLCSTEVGQPQLMR